jgi:hypothetical protein
LGDVPGEFWIHGMVRARTAEKARRKARRIQLKTGWPYMSTDPKDHIGWSLLDRRREKREKRA